MLSHDYVPTPDKTIYSNKNHVLYLMKYNNAGLQPVSREPFQEPAKQPSLGFRKAE